MSEREAMRFQELIDAGMDAEKAIAQVLVEFGGPSSANPNPPIVSIEVCQNIGNGVQAVRTRSVTLQALNNADDPGTILRSMVNECLSDMGFNRVT